MDARPATGSLRGSLTRDAFVATLYVTADLLDDDGLRASGTLTAELNQRNDVTALLNGDLVVTGPSTPATSVVLTRLLVDPSVRPDFAPYSGLADLEPYADSASEASAIRLEFHPDDVAVAAGPAP